MIIAGDFNATPWSQTLKTITVASQTRSVEGLRPSWLVNGTLAHAARWIGLPIDHILVSERIIPTRVETLTAGRLGSSADAVALFDQRRETMAGQISRQY